MIRRGGVDVFVCSTPESSLGSLMMYDLRSDRKFPVLHDAMSFTKAAKACTRTDLEPRYVDHYFLPEGSENP